MNNIVNGIGPLDAKLWIIEEAPDQQALDEGRPFVGAQGRFLRDYLRNNNIIESEVRLEYLINSRPPQNDFEYFESKEKIQILKESVERLKERIRAGKPNLVLLLGPSTLKHIMNLYPISNWRGHLLFSEDLGCKVMCAYRPSHCLRQRYAGATNPPGQYEALFNVDLQRAVKESKFRELKFPQYHTIVEPTYQEACDILNDILKNAKILSYDIETISNSLVDCIGFCWKEDLTVCIPLYYTPVERYWKSDAEFLTVFKLIKEIMESEIPKVAQNSQYDNTILAEYYKIKVKNLVWDTMVSAHDLYSDLPKDLGSLISFYTTLPYQKYLIKSGKIRDRWVYNAADALANLHIMRGEINEAIELRTLKHYKKIPHLVIKPLNEMQLIGNKIDLPRRDKAIKHESQFQEELIKVFDELFPVSFPRTGKSIHKFNPNSTLEKKILFINLFGCKAQYKDKVLTLDKNAMEKYSTDSRHYVSLLAKIIRQYRLSATMLARLETALKDGRMHTAYDVTGTDTGRLNSKESIFGTGTNLQNLSKGIQRQMIIPG